MNIQISNINFEIPYSKEFIPTNNKSIISYKIKEKNIEKKIEPFIFEKMCIIIKNILL